MSNKAIQNLLLNRTKTKIIETAERLFAEKGINNVSTREIAREAGQKNHSALHYHFGDKENLLDALLDYRLTPLDNKRKYLLDEVLNASKNPSLRELITVLITPMAENALDPKRKNYILKIMGELLTSADWRKKNRKGSFIHSKIKGNGNVIEQLEKNETLDKKLLRHLTVKVKKFDLETNYFSKNEDQEKLDKKLKN